MQLVNSSKSLFDFECKTCQTNHANNQLKLSINNQGCKKSTIRHEWVSSMIRVVSILFGNFQ